MACDHSVSHQDSDDSLSEADSNHELHSSLILDHSPDRENHDFAIFDGVETKELREQDRFLPIANIARIMKRVLPDQGKVSKDAKECCQECVSEFISFLTCEASERCQNEKRKTINGEDILYALQALGFDNYVEPLKVHLFKYREAVKGDKPTLLDDGPLDLNAEMLAQMGASGSLDLGQTLQNIASNSQSQQPQNVQIVLPAHALGQQQSVNVSALLQQLSQSSQPILIQAPGTSGGANLIRLNQQPQVNVIPLSQAKAVQQVTSASNHPNRVTVQQQHQQPTQILFFDQNGQVQLGTASQAQQRSS